MASACPLTIRTMVNLKDLSEEPRFQISVKVRILHSRSWTSTTVEFVVGEKDEAKYLLVLRQTDDMNLQQYAIGSSLLLCDADWNFGSLNVSSTNMLPTTSLTVSEEGRSQAKLLHSRPSPDPDPGYFDRPVEAILEASLDTFVSTNVTSKACVTIDSVEHIKMVKVKPEAVPRKDFRIRDYSGEMPAELWRNMAAIEIAPGQKWHFFGKVVENRQQEKVFRVFQAECLDETTSAPDPNWLSSNDHREGELLNCEFMHYYHCSMEGCSNKKLIHGTRCCTCGKISPMKSLYAKMELRLDGKIVELTAFSPELSQLYGLLGLDFDESLGESELQYQIIQQKPFVCGVKFAGDVVTNFRLNK